MDLPRFVRKKPRWIVEDYGELAGLIEAGNVRGRDETALDPGILVRRLRCSLHLTQEEVARRSGLSRSALFDLEAGKDVRLGTLRRALAALGAGFVVLPTADALLRVLRAKEAERRQQAAELEQHLPRASP